VLITGMREARSLRAELVAIEDTAGPVPGRARRVVASVPLAGPGTLQPGSVPFEVPVPAFAVPGYRTERTAVTWGIRAAADVAGADPDAGAELTIVPRAGLRPPNLAPGKDHGGRQAERTGNVLIGILIAGLFAIIAVAAFARGISAGEPGMLAFGGGALLMVALGAWLVRRDSARAKSSIPGIRVTPHVNVAAPGEAFVIECDPGTNGALEIGLVGEEWYTTRRFRGGNMPQGASTITRHEDPLYQAWQPLAAGAAAFTFQVPVDARPSYHGDTVSIAWEVRVRRPAGRDGRRVGIGASRVHRVPVTVTPI
jgi:hypothetical protein